MQKRELFDLIIKAFGVYLLVLTIMSLPNMLNGAIMITHFYNRMGYSLGGSDFDKLISVGYFSILSSSLSHVFKFIIYLVVSVDFLRSGFIVKLLMKRDWLDQKKEAEPASNSCQ